MHNTVSSKQLAKDWLNLQKHKHANSDLYRLKSTGLTKLDKQLGGGLEPGQYVIVGGAQKSGKTTLLSCMAESFAKQNMNVLYLSGEMTTMQMANMFFSRLSLIDRTRIRAMNLDNSDWVLLEKAAMKFEKLSIWWNHGFTSITDINEIVAETEATDNIEFDAIMIDYIQLMEAPEIRSNGNRSTELEFISRTLKHKTIAGKKPKIIVAASQVNRASIRGNLMDANSFLGSGSLERDMDVGMIIKPFIDKVAGVEDIHAKEISVVGSRESEIGSCKVFYNGKIATMQDADEDPDEQDIRRKY